MKNGIADETQELSSKDKLKRGWDVPYFIAPNSIFGIGLTSNALLVYLYLCRRSDGNHQSFPSLKLIVSDTNLSLATIKRALVELRSRRLLEIDPRFEELPNGRSRQKSNLYVIKHPDDATGDSGQERDNETPSGLGGDSHRAPGGVHTEPQGGFTQSPGGVHTEPRGGFTQSPQEVHSFRSTSSEVIKTRNATSEKDARVGVDGDSILQIGTALRELGIGISDGQLKGLLSKFGEAYLMQKAKFVLDGSFANPAAAFISACKDDWGKRNTPEERPVIGTRLRSENAVPRFPAAQPGKYGRFYDMFDAAKLEVATDAEH